MQRERRQARLERYNWMRLANENARSYMEARTELEQARQDGLALRRLLFAGAEIMEDMRHQIDLIWPDDATPEMQQALAGHAAKFLELSTSEVGSLTGPEGMVAKAAREARLKKEQAEAELKQVRQQLAATEKRAAKERQNGEYWSEKYYRERAEANAEKRDLALKLKAAEERAAKAERHLEFSGEWYGHRWARLHELLKDTPYREQASAIMANGTADWREAPQQYVLKADYDSLAAKVEQLEAQLSDSKRQCAVLQDTLEASAKENEAWRQAERQRKAKGTC